MRVLMPFYNVNDLDFYQHLVRSLKRYCSEEIIIAYVSGSPKSEWARELQLERLEVQSARSKSLEFFLSRKKIAEQVKKMKIDVIFALSELWTLEFSSYISEELKIPFVVWVRGDHRKVREARRVNRLKRALVNRLEVAYLNKATYVIPNSVSLYEKLQEWGVERSKITEPVHNGVDTEFFKPMSVPRAEEFTVAYAGRICPEKRVAELLEIAKNLKDIKFIIAGSKDIEVTFPENVEYLGKLPFEEMPVFYNMADLVVLPSVTEGFPSVILEAYACEKPVLATREAFPKELKVFGGVAGLDEFERMIRELQRADLRSIGKEARNYVKENFTWEKFGKSIRVFLEKAVSEA